MLGLTTAYTVSCRLLITMDFREVRGVAAQYAVADAFVGTCGVFHAST